MTRKYYDKNNELIKVGMKLRHNEGDVEEVISCGENNLGFNASNRKAGFAGEAYPLTEFSLSEWEIING